MMLHMVQISARLNSPLIPAGGCKMLLGNFRPTEELGDLDRDDGFQLVVSLKPSLRSRSSNATCELLQQHFALGCRKYERGMRHGLDVLYTQDHIMQQN